MTTPEPQPARRRMDRVLAPGLLQDLEDRSLDQLRALRDDCREEESRLSFVRRVTQARLDIVRAAIDRREGGGASDDLSVLGGLPEVLADEPAPAPGGGQRALSLHTPEEQDGRRRDDVLTDPSLGRLPDLDIDELRGLADRLDDEERRLSDLRRRVIAHLDALQAELVRRYAQDPGAIEQALTRALDRARQSG
jgi:hypothetical protein